MNSPSTFALYMDSVCTAVKNNSAISAFLSKMNEMPPMHLRIVTGIVLLVILLLALLCQGLLLWIIIAVVSSIAMREFYLLFKEDFENSAIWGSGIFFGVILLAVSYMTRTMPSLAMLAIVPLVLSWFLFSWAFIGITNFTQFALVLTGICYIPLLLSVAFSLNAAEQLFVIGITILADTAAYFAGKYFGKRKIWCVVSPNKTVEGCLAGLIVALIWSVLHGACCGAKNLAVYAVVGIFLALFSMLGDFFESSLKRLKEVKDSGKLLPGHGGMLDRIDSLLFALPAYAVIKYFIPLFK